jgi:hypothetical protein
MTDKEFEKQLKNIIKTIVIPELTATTMSKWKSGGINCGQYASTAAFPVKACIGSAMREIAESLTASYEIKRLSLNLDHF